MNITTKQEAVAFAKLSADMAFDQQAEYGGLDQSIQVYRDNIRDTLNDHGVWQFEGDAWAAFDSRIEALRPNT